MSHDAYPVRFDVDYPEELDLVTTLLRPILAIPILLLLSTLFGVTATTEAQGGVEAGSTGGPGLLFFAPLLMILFRRKYPRWWFDWNLELGRFVSRVDAYLLLLTDRYPATEEEQAVHLEIDYPDAERDLNRWLPLVKWLLALPHWFVLVFLWLATIVVVVIAWFAILFNGRYPKSLFDFVVGAMRWTWRVVAYSFLLTTDRYPPFRLA